jgi:hypothetical protein
MRRKDDVTLPTSPSSPNHGNRNPLEERWVYKGKGELVDLETVLVGGGIEDDGGRKRFEILSPEGSFAVYAGRISNFHHLLQAGA